MGLETDFNTSPYYDDFDELKNFHRILFKPAVAVQARELNQLQTILQNQVERFGNNILKEGTIITGGNFVEINPFAYVKINDNNTDGNSVDMTELDGQYAVGQVTGIRAKIETVLSGFESTTPNLNTLYVKYLNTNDNGDKTFSTSENLEIQDADGAVIDTVTVAGTADSNPIGNAYGVRCGDGIIFQKGHFVRFEDDITIVERYDTDPDNVLIGFKTTESTIDSNEDSSLLDNASGFNNANAPGADRLKLSPSLVVYTQAEADADESFFAIQEYRNGKVTRRRLTTVYNVIQKLMEQRSVEQNGNFVVNRFPLRIQEDQSNTDLLNIQIGRGLAYVEGRRVETFNQELIEFPRATDTSTVEDQEIVANYGNFIPCSNLSGAFDINTFEQVNLVDGAANTVGTAYIRSFTQTANNSYRAYIFNTEINSGFSFEDVRTIENASASADVRLDASNNAVITDVSYKSVIYPIGKDAIKNLDLSETNYVYRAANTTATMTTGGLVTLNLPVGDTFQYTVGGTLNSTQKNDLTLVSTETQAPWTDGDVIPIANATVTVVSSSQLTIQLPDAGDYPAAEMDVTVYHNAERPVSTVNSKTLKTVYVKIDVDTHSANTSGPYSLGLPDVYSVEAVYVGNTYSANNTDLVDEFSLTTNQKDTHYGLSYITPNAGAVSSGDKLLVEAKVFQNTSGVKTFFSVDSYPVDDVTEPLPVNKIRTEDIPSYTTDSGSKILLRDAIDLRPHAANTAAYATTEGTATENPSSTLSFGSSNQFFIGPNKAVETNFDYYLGRIDRLVLNSQGEFYIINGEPADNPTAPAIPPKTISPAIITVNPFPSLPIGTASLAERTEYSVYLSRINNDNYYPSDIRRLERRIEALEDYTSLSILEKNTTDLSIKDENGLERFKNGILVDDFKDLTIGDITDDQFAASIDPSVRNLYPKFRTFPLDLSVSSSSGVINYSKATMLASTSEAVITQKYASSQKSCTTDFWKFNGNITLTPSMDSTSDTVNQPENNSNNGVPATPRLVEFTPIFIQGGSAQTRMNNLIFNLIGMRNAARANEAARQAAENGEVVEPQQSSSETENAGRFVTSVDFSPWLRSRNVQIRVTGMRPNTQVYFYFDKQDISEHVAAGTFNTSENRVIRSGEFGAGSIKTDSNGNLYAIFRIPANTFTVGDKVLEIYDINSYNSRGSASTSATATYTGFNLNVESENLPPAPIPAVSNPQGTIPGVAGRPNDPSWGPGGGSGEDPLAQTFIIDADFSDDTVVMIPSVDLYFARKSDTNGCTVQIREVLNGYPSSTVLPYGSKHLSPSEITANNTSATEKTTVSFDTPVILKTNTEYALVVKPDANDPDYLVWISRTGETDVDTDFNIVQDTNAGVLFTSTNNKAWTPYQNENLKFTLYKANFTSSSGSVVLTNNNDEFFEVSNNNAIPFVDGEYVFIDNANTFLSGNVSVLAGNTTITGTATSFTSEYSEGEHIVINYPANTQVLEIGSISNNTSMTVLDIPRADATDVQHFSSVVGRVAQYYNRTPKTLVLTESTAKTGSVFANSDIIVGEDSGAEATITELKDMEISYVQPNIMQSNFSKTKTTASGSFNSVAGQYAQAIKFDSNNLLTGKASYIKSRSNEIVEDAGDNSFELTMNLSSTSSDSSPVVDFDVSSIISYKYFINNDSTNEDTNDGNAEAKYVSRKIELADGLDAEDVRVFLTAYRPPNTDIEVFVKMQSSADSADFKDVPWTKLIRDAKTDVTSSSANQEDFREFEYTLDELVLGNGEGAYLETGNTFKYKDLNGAVYNNYKFFAVKIVMLSSSHQSIPKIKDMRTIALS